MAIGGDYMSAASFLGIAGIIALYGYDGFLYSIGFLVAWLVALLLVAELMRNSGKYTMADVLAFRMRQRPVRTAAGVSTIVVSIFYLLAQMVGAGALVALLLGIKPAHVLGMDATPRRSSRSSSVGALMIIYVTVGGMKGTTYVQIVKAFLLMTGATLMTLLVLFALQVQPVSACSATPPRRAARARRSSSPACATARRSDARQRDARRPSTARSTCSRSGIALVLGTAGLPHILIRFYTVPTAKAARKSVLWAIGIIGIVLPVDPGAGLRRGGAGRAARRSPPRTRPATPPRRSWRRALGNDVFGGDTGGDDPAGGHRGGRVRHDPRGRRRAHAGVLVVAWRTTSTPTSSSAARPPSGRRSWSPGSRRSSSARSPSCCRIFAQNLNVAFLVALAFAVAASGNLPAILYSLFWKRFNTAGRGVGASTAA